MEAHGLEGSAGAGRGSAQCLGLGRNPTSALFISACLLPAGGLAPFDRENVDCKVQIGSQEGFVVVAWYYSFLWFL